MPPALLETREYVLKAGGGRFWQFHLDEVADEKKFRTVIKIRGKGTPGSFAFQAFIGKVKIVTFDFTLTEEMIYENAELGMWVTIGDDAAGEAKSILESSDQSVMIVLPPQETRYLLTSPETAKEKKENAERAELQAKGQEDNDRDIAKLGMLLRNMHRPKQGEEGQQIEKK